MIKSFSEFNAINESTVAFAVLPKPGKDNFAYNYNTLKGAIKTAINYLESDNKIGGHEYLLEIAMAESMLGTHPNTVRMGSGDRGPFQLNKVGFDETKNVKSHPGLTKYHDNLKKHGIDWSKISVDDCNKAIYGAIAARLLLLTIPDKIPSNLSGRAQQWKKYYNSSLGKGTAKKYIERVNYCSSVINKLRHRVFPYMRNQVA